MDGRMDGCSSSVCSPPSHFSFHLSLFVPQLLSLDANAYAYDYDVAPSPPPPPALFAASLTGPYPFIYYFRVYGVVGVCTSFLFAPPPAQQVGNFLLCAKCSKEREREREGEHID
uniref:Uncharacterized protein n=1 Tax=Caenorhabditis japonica TaxID=281687 RepID=A0A8R1EGC1_CAEJA